MHPEFHPVAQGDFDLTHALHKLDVAYLVLAKAIDGYESMFGYGDFLRAGIKGVR